MGLLKIWLVVASEAVTPMARRADRAEPCRKSCCTGAGRRCVPAQTCTQTSSLMRRPPRRVSASRPTL
eukprot:7885579-Lingulodinium_polyedra.AAC.1